MLGPLDLACGPHHKGLPKHGEEGSGSEETDTEKEYPAVYNLGQHQHQHPSGTTFEELEEWHCRTLLDKRLTPLDLGVVISSNWQDLWQVV